MQQIVEATIDQIGRVRLDKKIKLDRKHKALVTILDESPKGNSEPGWSLVGSIKIIDEDLEKASRDISEEVNKAIQKSIDEFQSLED